MLPIYPGPTVTAIAFKFYNFTLSKTYCTAKGKYLKW
jgi:hypothetical protein